ncbi:hypothetical protein AAVH_35874, partial [Aphelenchoides avenae]
MIAFIYRDRQRKIDLRTGFFALFLAVSTSEWLVTNSVPNAFGQAAAFAAVLPCKVYMSFSWFHLFHGLVHTAIAFNRFSCFHYADRLDCMWTPRYIRVQLLIYGVISTVVMLLHMVPQCTLVVVSGHIMPALNDAWLTV